MKTLLLSSVVALVLAAGAQAQAQTIADWTFETSAPTTAGPFAPEVGAGSASGFHASTSVAYSSPAGNGSTHSFSSSYWSLNDYYQFQVSTVGYQSLSLTYDQTSSNTGPGTFQLAYSTNGVTFTNFGSAYTVLANASPNTPWTSSSYNPAYTFTDNLSSIGALNNQGTVYFRIVDAGTVSANGGTIGTGGTDRVDNFDLVGTATATPEPASWALAAVAVAGFTILRSRRVRA